MQSASPDNWAEHWHHHWHQSQRTRRVYQPAMINPKLNVFKNSQGAHTPQIDSAPSLSRRIRPRAGRVERAIRRHLILSKQLTTPELAQRIYSATKYWQVGNIRRAAKFAVECGRQRSPGCPVLWRLK
jgi:hypothetical protein